MRAYNEATAEAAKHASALSPRGLPELFEEQQGKREAQRMRREALTAASEARRRHPGRLLSQRTPKGEVLQQVALVFVGAGNALGWEDYELAWGLLDVAGHEVSDGEDATTPYCPTRPKDPRRARAGLALAFAISEGFRDFTWNAEWIRARAHLDFLQRPYDMGWKSQSAPSSAVANDKHQYVFWLGSNGDIWEAYLQGSSWSAPYDMGRK